MPRRALRSYPTKDATDLTDEPWAALAPLVVTPSPNGGRPTEIDRRAIVNVPLVLGTPCRRGSIWVAASNARASALKSASIL